MSNSVQPILLNGAWAASQATATFQAVNPVTEQPMPQTFPVSPCSEIDAVIGHAARASAEMRGWPGSRFNRERFLLGCLAGIFLAQFILYGVGVGLCAHLLDQRYAQLRSKGCPEILNRL
ncbi:MAG: hypothetical protein WCK86_22600, partial [Planctomycetia bacterium]